MDHWCFNNLRVDGPIHEIARFKKQAWGILPWPEFKRDNPMQELSFHSLVPVPAEILAAGYKPEGERWAFDHWGCLSGAHRVDSLDPRDEVVIYRFWTQLSPAILFVEEVSRRWPELVFEFDYRDTDPHDGYWGFVTLRAGNVQKEYTEDLA